MPYIRVFSRALEWWSSHWDMPSRVVSASSASYIAGPTKVLRAKLYSTVTWHYYVARKLCTYFQQIGTDCIMHPASMFISLGWFSQRSAPRQRSLQKGEHVLAN